MLPPRNSIRVLAGLLLIAACGCEQRFGTVQGTVFINGKPANNGTVIFSGGDNFSASGAIRPDGHYEISNVPVGPCKVALQQMVMLGGGPPRPGPLKGLAQPADAAGPAIPIPKKYQNVDTSGLSYTISGGLNEIEIKLLSQ